MKVHIYAHLNILLFPNFYLLQWDTTDFLCSSSFELPLITPSGLFSRPPPLHVLPLSHALSQVACLTNQNAPCVSNLILLLLFSFSFLATFHVHGIVFLGNSQLRLCLELSLWVQSLLRSSTCFTFQVWSSNRTTDWYQWWNVGQLLSEMVRQDVREVTLHLSSCFPGMLFSLL